MRRSWLALLLPFSYALVVACVGDDPDATSGTGTPDGGNTNPNGEDGSGSSSSGSNPGNDAGGDDASTDADAAEPKCGYPGEDCCAAPSLPCRAGTTCGTSNQKCMVTELAAVNTYFYVQSTPSSVFENHVGSAFYDSNGWRVGPNVESEYAFSTWSPYDITSSGPNQYHVVMSKSGNGKMKSFNGASWAKCEIGQSCVGPAIPSPDFWSVARIGQDIWIGATNKIYRCAPGSNCANTVTGLESTTWGTGKIVGTSAQDVWYSAGNRAFHYDGATWTIHESLQASTIFEVRKDDVWVGGSTLQHWNGTAWTNPMTINGSNAPGTVTSISGSGANDVWAVGDSAGGVYTAHWDGMSWTLKTAPAAATGSPTIYAPSPLEAFLACPSGVYRWDGSAWTKMTMAVFDGGENTEPPSWQIITGPAKPRP